MGDYAGGGAGVLHRAADGIERFVARDHTPFALAVLAVLVVIQIPGVDDLLAELGVTDSDRLRTAALAIVFAAILLDLHHLKRAVSPAISGRQQFPDPDEMYDALREKALSITDPEQREIRVLGLTLYSAWPKLSFFLERPEVTAWRVQLATLSKDAHGPDHWVPGDWPSESELTVNQILQFRERQGREHQHEIEVFEYEFPPAVHGFELGNGDVFVSTLHWQPEGRLGKHRFSYDYVPAHDVSPGATAARELFRNWFRHAVEGGAEEAPGRLR